MTDDAPKHSLGQHFTPVPLVRLVCSLGIREPSARVLDPACGDGAFLRGALERLAALGCNRPQHGQVCGFEIDPAHAASAGSIPHANVIAADFFSREPRPEFDSIVGNFPFVRQELLASRKQALVGLVQSEWAFEFQGVMDLSARADLYLYFFFHAAKFLRPGGRMAVISGNSWLHVPYGQPLRRFLLEKLRLEMILESRAEAFFPDTEANPLITVVQRAEPAGTVSFVQLNSPLDARPPDAGLPADATVRRVPAAKLAASDGWNFHLRAPDVYFDLLESAGNRRVPLEKVAEVHRGVTTGLNSFFFIPRKKAAELGIEPEFLTPVIVSLRGVNSLVLAPDHAQHYLLTVDGRDRRSLVGTNVLQYIEEFERCGRLPANSPTLKGRREWFHLTPPAPGQLVIPRFRRQRHFTPANPCGILVGDTVFTARLHNSRHAGVCFAAANSTLFHFLAEVSGRDNMGGGFITTYGPEIKALPVPDPRFLTAHEKQLTGSFEALASRDVQPTKDEIGRPDRRLLDEGIWRALALPRALLDEMYAAFTELLERRRLHGAAARTPR